VNWLAFQVLRLFDASLYRHAAGTQGSPEARGIKQHTFKGQVEDQSLDSGRTAFMNREADSH